MASHASAQLRRRMEWAPIAAAMLLQLVPLATSLREFIHLRSPGRFVAQLQRIEDWAIFVPFQSASEITSAKETDLVIWAILRVSPPMVHLPRKHIHFRTKSSIGLFRIHAIFAARPAIPPTITMDLIVLTIPCACIH